MQKTQETQVRSLGGEDPLDKATHSGRLAWRTPWREEPGGLQSMGRGCHGSDMTEQGTSLPERYPVVSGKFASQTESDRKWGRGKAEGQSGLPSSASFFPVQNSPSALAGQTASCWWRRTAVAGL